MLRQWLSNLDDDKLIEIVSDPRSHQTKIGAMARAELDQRRYMPRAA